MADLPATLMLSVGEVPLVTRVNPRCRRLSVHVCMATRSIRLTMPPRSNRRRLQQFLNAHHDWLERQARRSLLPPIPFAPGVRLPLGDGEVQLQPGEGRIARHLNGCLLVPGIGEIFARRTARWLKQEAKRLLTTDTSHYARMLDRPAPPVRLGDFRSRWGSCASDGRIAYSWRLVFAPLFVRHAVVAHEVAHLREMHHGPAFWALATSLLGKPHDEARRWLRENAPLLMSYGASDQAPNQASARALATASFKAS